MSHNNQTIKLSEVEQMKDKTIKRNEYPLHVLKLHTAQNKVENFYELTTKCHKWAGLANLQFSQTVLKNLQLFNFKMIKKDIKSWVNIQMTVQAVIQYSTT